MPAGYECTFVEDVPEDYICCICRCAMRSPVQTKCGHRFCKFCLNSSLKSLNRCPVDRVNLSAQDMFNDKATERKILSFKIKCVNQGCEWQGELRNLMLREALIE
ncbi:TNF receptor-associated factor 6-B [Exaiptasia diaphana]|nr:TNF receptor-associated factor 6-B [Exaiptasia diaphana]